MPYFNPDTGLADSIFVHPAPPAGKAHIRFPYFIDSPAPADLPNQQDSIFVKLDENEEIGALQIRANCIRVWQVKGQCGWGGN